MSQDRKNPSMTALYKKLFSGGSNKGNTADAKLPRQYMDDASQIKGNMEDIEDNVSRITEKATKFAQIEMKKVPTQEDLVYLKYLSELSALDNKCKKMESEIINGIDINARKLAQVQEQYDDFQAKWSNLNGNKTFENDKQFMTNKFSTLAEEMNEGKAKEIEEELRDKAETIESVIAENTKPEAIFAALKTASESNNAEELGGIKELIGSCDTKTQQSLQRLAADDPNMKEHVESAIDTANEAAKREANAKEGTFEARQEKIKDFQVGMTRVEQMVDQKMQGLLKGEMYINDNKDPALMNQYKKFKETTADIRKDIQKVSYNASKVDQLMNKFDDEKREMNKAFDSYDVRVQRKEEARNKDYEARSKMDEAPRFRR